MSSWRGFEAWPNDIWIFLAEALSYEPKLTCLMSQNCSEGGFRLEMHSWLAHSIVSHLHASVLSIPIVPGSQLETRSGLGHSVVSHLHATQAPTTSMVYVL